MRISVLTIGAVASILTINSVFATTSTVTSKDYVDAADALKQNKIPATGTNSSTPGTTVVTYTDTAGTIGERGIFNPATGIDTNTGDVASGHEGDLLTAGDIVPLIDNLYSGRANTVVVRNFIGAPVDARGIYDGSTTYNSSTDADKLVTASVVQNVSNNLPTVTTSKMTCVDAPDCTLWTVSDRTVYGQCKEYGVAATDAGECCSGVLLNGVNSCGCISDDDCEPGVECVLSGHYCNDGHSK